VPASAHDPFPHFFRDEHHGREGQNEEPRTGADRRGFEDRIAERRVADQRDQRDVQTLIQFSAPISPGSSGGGLFDRDGEAVGITAASENLGTGPRAPWGRIGTK
jgi:hypothetical protein